jgi:hypothetical protein
MFEYINYFSLSVSFSVIFAPSENYYVQKILNAIIKFILWMTWLALKFKLKKKELWHVNYLNGKVILVSLFRPFGLLAPKD